jgi:hypothetical protein
MGANCRWVKEGHKVLWHNANDEFLFFEGDTVSEVQPADAHEVRAATFLKFYETFCILIVHMLLQLFQCQMRVKCLPFHRQLNESQVLRYGSILRYIVDGAKPFSAGLSVAQSIVVHDPSPHRYKDYMKVQGAANRPLFMPFWDIAELDAVREKLHPHISHMDVSTYHVVVRPFLLFAVVATVLN